MHRIGSTTLDNVAVPGVGRMCVWDNRSDSINVWNYIKNLQNLEYEIRYCIGRYPQIRRDLKIIKHNMQKQFLDNIDRIWNDQKSGTYFPKGMPFEPHQVSVRHNLVMWDAITRFTELIAGESSKFFYYMLMGTGTTEPTFADPGLETEVARVDMRIAGDINSDGITLKNTAAFPTGVPTLDITEFGASDSDSDGTLEYRVLVEGSPLHHKQGETFVQASHTIVLQPVENIIS
jgi:hypothetical protein